MSKNLTRRRFLQTSAAATFTAAVGTSSRPILGANNKLNIAAVGAGGKGSADISGCARENIVALCDVDEKSAARTFEKYPNVPKFKDYRVMLDKMGGEIDAITVTTPDHMHAPVAMNAMQRGIHVYVQKPLTQTVYEARVLQEAAHKYKVKTQMGNQGHSGPGVRRMAEMIWRGDIGQVREVHCWTNRPSSWPQGFEAPAGSDPVPATLDWDLWLGAAADRPFVATNPDYPNKPAYLPGVWRGYWDFGSVALGDMACHIMDNAFYALQLGYPTSFETVMQHGRTAATGPIGAIVRFDFPKRTATLPNGETREFDPVSVFWYDGRTPDKGFNKPPRPEGVPENEILGDDGNGSLFIGTDGIATSGEYGGKPRLLPESRELEHEWPDPWLPKARGGHYRDWLSACRGEQEQACSNFDYSAPFTETVLIGSLAERIGEQGKVYEYDGANMRITNDESANQYLTKDYRDGFGLA